MVDALLVTIPKTHRAIGPGEASLAHVKEGVWQHPLPFRARPFES
jgi:hypothetical protein